MYDIKLFSITGNDLNGYTSICGFVQYIYYSIALPRRRSTVRLRLLVHSYTAITFNFGPHGPLGSALDSILKCVKCAFKVLFGDTRASNESVRAQRIKLECLRVDHSLHLNDARNGRSYGRPIDFQVQDVGLSHRWAQPRVKVDSLMRRVRDWKQGRSFFLLSQHIDDSDALQSFSFIQVFISITPFVAVPLSRLATKRPSQIPNMDGLPGADLPIADAIKLLYQTAKDLWTIRVSSSLNTAYLLTDLWTKVCGWYAKEHLN